MASIDKFLVEGWVAPGFEPAREVFAENFEKHGEIGAAFCLYLDGQKVVDIWGGIADETTGRKWEKDTLIPVFSVTKAATTACALLLFQRGELNLDAPVAEYWPEFRAGGKAEIPVKWLLAHRAGLPCLDSKPSVGSALVWGRMVEALAGQKPLWKPGTTHGYHSTTFGWLVGEVVRRISGCSLGTYFAEEIAKPLGLDFWIGLPEEMEPRVGRLIPLQQTVPPKDFNPNSLPEHIQLMVQARRDPNSITSRTLNLTQTPLDDNAREVHAAEIPARNGVTNARSLARMYAAFIGEIDGLSVLSPDTAKTATVVQSDGPDRVLFAHTKFGMGFMLASPFSPFGGGNCFGHPGAGGSLGFADPDAGYAFGYVTNNMSSGLSGDPRTTALIGAVKSCIPNNITK